MRYLKWAALVIAFLAFATTAAPAAPPRRDTPDQEFVTRMKARAPHAVELLEQAEAKASSGALDDALRLFRQGAAEDPYGAGLFERRECEALTSLNRRPDALRACWQALQDFRTPSAVAATVRALVSGPNAPTYFEVDQALGLLMVERTRAPGQPQLAAAMCDIAESIGDGVMLQQCVLELERIAPEYGPTRRARAALDARCPPWRFWAGWFAIVAVTLITLASAVRRLLSRGAAGGVLLAKGALSATVIVASLGLSSVARADGEAGHWLSHWPINDKDPESSVPTQDQFSHDPLEGGYWLQDVLLKGELASKHGDHEAAIKFYLAVAKAVPSRAIPMIKMCDEFEAMNQLDKATNACGLALMLDGVTLKDYTRYLHLLFKRPGKLNDKEVAAAANVINHVKEETSASTVGDELECELGTRTADVDILKRCTAALTAKAPDAPSTITYRWALALRQGDFGSARKLVERAKAVGVKDEGIQNMLKATAAGASWQKRSLALIAIGVVFLVGASLYAARMFNKKREAAAPA
jgi:hypothetical protein